jgi:hypothetical protein
VYGAQIDDTSGICETPQTRSLFYFPVSPVTLHDSLPRGARSVPLRPAKKLHYGPEPRHPRKRTHDRPNGITRRDIVRVRGSAGEHGDERGEEGGFERGAEERWEGCGVDRLPIRW